MLNCTFFNKKHASFICYKLRLKIENYIKHSASNELDATMLHRPKNCCTLGGAQFSSRRSAIAHRPKEGADVALF